MIKLTVKGLAKYMTSSPATQRKTLRDYKFPDPEGAVQAKYYAEARRAIEQFHSAGNDPAVAAMAVDQLRLKATRETGKKRDRIENNIRALEDYLRNFGKTTLEVLSTPELKYSRGQIVVSCFPDLYVKDGNAHKIIKLDFSKQLLKPEAIRVVLQVTFAAAQAAKLSIKPQDVIYVDVVRGARHRGARVRARLMRDVEATCQTIEDIWPNIQR